MNDFPIASDASSGNVQFHVLFVCTGNVHRSPLAECLLRARLAPLAGVIQVGSAGTAATAGMPMDPVAASVLVRLGGDPRGARARRLTAALVNDAHLVLGAAAEHREAVVRRSPLWALQRAFTLREFARLVRAGDAADVSGPAERAAALVRGAAARRGAGGASADDDVADPFGAPVRVAHEAAARIAESVERIAAVMLASSPECRGLSRLDPAVPGRV